MYVYLLLFKFWHQPTMADHVEGLGKIKYSHIDMLSLVVWWLWLKICSHMSGPSGNHVAYLKVIYHPLYSMNNFVTNKSKLPQDGAQVFSYMGWLAIMWPSQRTMIGYHVTLSEGHMIANHSI